MLAGPRGTRLDPKKPVGFEALAGLPLLTYRPPNYLRLMTEAGLRKQGFAFKATVELETLPLTIELIKRGTGYGVIPRSALRHDARVTMAPLRGPCPSLVATGLYHNSECPRASTRRANRWRRANSRTLS